MKYCKRIYEQISPKPESPDKKPCKGDFETFQETYGLIVLGDAGIGKTTDFEREAQKNKNSEFIKASSFLAIPESRLNEKYAKKNIYIDGFDEVRATLKNNQTSLSNLIDRIYKTNCSKFRLSCRSIEWDNIDLNSIKEGLLSENTSLKVLNIIPLTDEQIKEVISDELSDTEKFLQDAKDNSFFELLGNPQSLSMFLEVYKTGETVTGRFDLYDKACRILATEENSVHAEDHTPIDNILDISGLICTIHLLSNSEGVAIKKSKHKDGNHPYFLDKLNEKDVSLFKAATKTRLFNQVGTDTITPCHRTIAEYLSARHITKQARIGIPFGRMLGLMTGFDGGTLSDLRGLYAWLATLYHEKSEQLISADPIGILIYGDISSFSPSHKKKLLNSLKKLSLKNPWFIDDARTNKQRVKLICPDLKDEIIEILNKERKNIYLLIFILEAMKNKMTLDSDFLSPLNLVIQDHTLNNYIHSIAVKSLNKIHPKNIKNLKSILNQVHLEKLKDKDLRIREALLSSLYPKHLNITECLEYCIPNPELMLAEYWRFIHCFAYNVSSKDLPELVTAINKSSDNVHRDHLKKRIVPNFLVRLFEEYGQETNAYTLYDWLECTIDTRKLSIRIGGEQQCLQEKITAYYSINTKVYKKLFEHWLKYIAQENKYPLSDWEFNQRIMFKERNFPPNFGYYLLDKARETNNFTIKAYLFTKALYEGCFLKKFDAPSYDDFLVIRNEHQLFFEIFKQQNVCDLGDCRIDDMKRSIDDRNENFINTQKSKKYIENNIDQISQGKLSNALYYISHTYFEPEKYWEKDHNKFQLDKLEKNYSEKDCHAILCDLEAFISNECVPSIKKISSLEIKNQTLKISNPFMYGCRIALRNKKYWYKNQTDKTLIYALYNGFVNSNSYMFDNDDWFYNLVFYKKELFIMMVKRTTGLSLSKNHDNIAGLDKLLTDVKLLSISKELIPEFIRKYKKIKPNNLSPMLSFCLMHTDWENIKHLTKARSNNTKGEVKNLWQAALFMGDHKKYGQNYEAFVGKSKRRASSLATILNLTMFSDDAINTSNIHMIERTIRILGRFFSPHGLQESSGEQAGFGDPYQISNKISCLINQITNSLNEEASNALSRLSLLPALKKWKAKLLNAHTTNIQKRRERTFKYRTVDEIITIISNGKPQSHKDLKELTQSHIENLAEEYTGSPTNKYQKFWIMNKGKPDKHEWENSCRDRLIEDLSIHLSPLHIHIEPEGAHKGQKSSDIKIIYNEYILPIEVKNNDNKEVWTAIKTQLIDQYVIDPQAQGHGLFIAFWFGFKCQKAPPKNLGISKPKTPKDLQIALKMQIPNQYKAKIDVIVLDLSVPKTSKQKKLLTDSEVCDSSSNS